MTPEEAAYWARIEQDFPGPSSKYFVTPDWIKEWGREGSGRGVYAKAAPHT